MSSWPHLRPPRIAAAALAAALLLTAGGCIFTKDAVAPLSLDVPRGKKTLEVRTPAKAHLDDGSVVLFTRGFTLEGDQLRGVGEQYDLTRTPTALVQTVPVARVVALQTFGQETLPLESTAGILIGTPIVLGASILGVLLLVVLF